MQLNLKFLFIVLSLFSLSVLKANTLDWSEQERGKIKQFSWNSIPKKNTDPSNKYLDSQAAVKLGKALFNDTRLSRNLKVSCASCHIKEQAFTDNKSVALGVRKGMRNTPSLHGVAHNNWFFWDGRKDSLWAQALSSIENPAEHGFTRLEMFKFISGDPDYRRQYDGIFEDKLPDLNIVKKYPDKAGPNGSLKELIAWKKLSKEQRHTVNRFFTNSGKAIAAYVSTIKNQPARFDSFVKELSEKGSSKILNESEKRGLKLFISKNSGCANCHSGALFSNKEFHNIGTGLPTIDNGRSEVIESVLWDIFNCLGEFSDARPEQCTELKYVNRNRHALTGAYKTPSLRNLSKSAPYMHDGRFESLKKVVEYYAGIDKKSSQDIDLPIISLSENDQADLVNFLLTL